MSYSKKYREQTIEYRQSRHTLKEPHRIFKVSRSTIQKWEKQMKEMVDLGKKELHRGFRKIDPKKLKAYVAECGIVAAKMRTGSSRRSSIVEPWTAFFSMV